VTGTASITTVQGLVAAVKGIRALRGGDLSVKPIQDHLADLERLVGSAQ